ncbi:transposase [uncultured Phascolarctobacterium sp.]|uniref:transposase n=1 Tax=uncultured Phascolarctobacterium sp. TaxID=512296 RepID=UPI002632021A|nr:transposase [uncultured Phascolarctobacterium sp.]
MDPVYAAGLLAELGTIENFSSDDALAKYAGLTWRETQSGNFRADDTTMTKAGNSYFRYYLLEAVGSLIRHDAVYAEFYQKKYAEVKLHQHKRALVLTARKFVRLIFGLLVKNQLYSQSGVSRT